MGMGKTRLVLSHVLQGSINSISKWNIRLGRTVIFVPNVRVKRAWLRELLLLAYCRGLLSNCNEDVVRSKGVNDLEIMLKEAGIVPPSFKTFRKIDREKRPPKGKHCHYLIIDEWHRLPQTTRNACRKFLFDKRRSYWFIGGKDVKRKLYLVSATPINPVLEVEHDIKENAYDDKTFQNKIKDATKNAIYVVLALLGKSSMSKEGTFLEMINSIGVKEITKYGNTRLKWKIPSEASLSPTSLFDENRIREEECIIIKNFLDEEISFQSNDSITREYAYAVGLIRTYQKDGKAPHIISASKKGKKLCFGEPYRVLYCPNDLQKRRVEALTWLREKHTRLRRLINVLINENILKKEAQKDRYILTNNKALIFCTHKAVAIGLVKGLKELLYQDDTTDKRLQVVDTNVGKPNDYIENFVTEFNRVNKPPFILVLTDALSESIDLHERCKLIVHYELPWSPIRLFQRIGRLTRLKTWGDKVVFNNDVRTAHIIIPGSVEEERVNRLIRRIEFLSREKLWPGQYANKHIISGLIGSGPSLHYEEYKRGV